MHIGEFLVAVAQTSAAINVAALAVCATRVSHCGSGSEKGEGQDQSFHWCNK